MESLQSHLQLLHTIGADCCTVEVTLTELLQRMSKHRKGCRYSIFYNDIITVEKTYPCIEEGLKATACDGPEVVVGEFCCIFSHVER